MYDLRLMNHVMGLSVEPQLDNLKSAKEEELNMETAGTKDRLMQEKKDTEQDINRHKKEGPAIASNQLQPWYLEIELLTRPVPRRP